MCTHHDIIHTCGCDTRLSRACPAAGGGDGEPCPQMRVTRLTFSESECAACKELDMVDDAPPADFTTGIPDIEEELEEGREREDGGRVGELDQGWLYVL
ncbi:hypothetical protein NpPPO83_00010900 [Neofusicoccum parvum]|uniref:Uncharacterized protein n=1 Tax=Neofusicoccum parvum TaxID=310453 RepID=A0ACB5SQB5_9PEZI|nr:hypothetical protein NpPPO83_00010900 [Neofusicoccum parvum]